MTILFGRIRKYLLIRFSIVFHYFPWKRRLLNTISFLKRYKTRFSHISPNIFIATDNKTSIYFNQIERGTLYLPTTSLRIQEIGASYGVAGFDFKEDDVVIDVGSNIGEFGLFVKSACHGVNVISVEPEVNARSCCNLNLYDGLELTIDKAIWNTTGKSFLWRDESAAGSSMIMPKHGLEQVLIDVMTLDDLYFDLKLDLVKLIKIEAEGAEPEVISGGSNIWPKTLYCCIDVGPERGINRDSTRKSVQNQLESFGFNLIWESPSGDRETILMRNALLFC